MPLPAALLARLKKRGIVRSNVEPEPEEEVIAEDYDDQTKQSEGADIPDDFIPARHAQEFLLLDQGKENVCLGCPNKSNIYHNCSSYCREKWGSGKPCSSPATERKRLHMLKKYPVPAYWQEVYDPGTARHYYWNMESDEVSWLPPNHPRSKISFPASKLRKLLKEVEDLGENGDAAMDDDGSGSDEEEMEIEKKKVERQRDRTRQYGRQRERYRGGRTERKGNDLDPMDPAAYSDVPRGTWSTGLEHKGEAETGADTTASGPLYQMRPYPSPGAVLRMNAEHKKPVPDK